MQRFFQSENFRDGATSEAIADAEMQLGLRLPTDYANFLRLTNGYEGLAGRESYLMLWKADELKTFNDGYQVKEYVPGCLLIGSDGSGEAYGFDTRLPHWRVVQVPFVGMNWEVAELVGFSFSGFLEQL